jgi:aquaporin Z
LPRSVSLGHINRWQIIGRVRHLIGDYSMAKLLTEFIGTFFLALTVGLTTVSGTEFAPLAIGGALMVMVYMGGHISGGHYNPAVSLGVWLRGKLAPRDLGGYVVAQLLGAVIAALTVNVIAAQAFAPEPGLGSTKLGAFLAEALFTFALVLVVLQVATSEKTAGNSYFGLAIGGTIVAAVYAGGPISGGVFNPAVDVGPILVNVLLGGGSLGDAWLYLVGPLVGGAAAAGVFRLQE